MEELKTVLARNIFVLRKRAGMTQMELASELNYSDKAVSKWERGEGVPDVAVLMQISRIFGVSLDWLTEAEHGEKPTPPPTGREKRNRAIITALSVSLVWLVATMIFVIFGICRSSIGELWLSFVYAVPVSLVVLLVFNSIWWNPRRNYLIISFLVWSVLLCLFVSLAVFGFASHTWLLFILGVPAQAIILLWSGLGKR